MEWVNELSTMWFRRGTTSWHWTERGLLIHSLSTLVIQYKAVFLSVNRRWHHFMGIFISLVVASLLSVRLLTNGCGAFVICSTDTKIMLSLPLPLLYLYCRWCSVSPIFITDDVQNVFNAARNFVSLLFYWANLAVCLHKICCHVYLEKCQILK